MGATVTHGITSDTPNRIEFDAGAVYLDWGEPGEELVGATRGGAKFSVEEDIRQAEVDGASFGPVEDLRRSISITVTLAVTLAEWSLAQLTRMLRGTSTSDGVHRLITPVKDIAASDYLVNVSLVASVMGNSDPCILQLLNVLETGPWDITTGDQDEGQLAVNFMAHYSIAAPTVPPYRIYWPVGAS